VRGRPRGDRNPEWDAPLLPPSLPRRRPELVEWMDREDSDPVRIQNTFHQFRHVNRWIARWPTLYRRHLRPLLHPERPTRLLDVGCGGGDVARSLARWAARDGLRLEVTAIDPDPRGPAFARGMEAAGVTFRQASTGDLVAEGARFHLVTCNHVLHHLPADLLPRFLQELEALASRRILVSEIERSRVGYLLFSLGTPLLFRNSYIRTDGLVSIQRSFTPSELREVLPPGWTVARLPPYRLLALWDPEAARTGR
jgi:2-polyprenyl-3-methyl-5-hydroxy-6-metoxy-1,4-benzoquinol methylase